MASTILFVLFVSPLLRAAFLLPISEDAGRSMHSDSAQDVGLSERNLVFNIKTVLRRDENSEQVKNLYSVPFDAGVKRTKREIIAGNQSCDEGMVWLVYRCVTREKFDELKGDDEYINEDVQLTERPVVFDPGRDVDAKPTNSSTFHVNVESIKNETIEEIQSCAQGMVWLTDRCVMLEMTYKRLTEDYDIMSTQAPQKGAAPRIQVFFFIPVVLLAISFQ